MGPLSLPFMAISIPFKHFAMIAISICHDGPFIIAINGPCHCHLWPLVSPSSICINGDYLELWPVCIAISLWPMGMAIIICHGYGHNHLALWQLWLPLVFAMVALLSLPLMALVIAIY